MANKLYFLLNVKVWENENKGPKTNYQGKKKNLAFKGRWEFQKKEYSSAINR